MGEQSYSGDILSLVADEADKIVDKILESYSESQDADVDADVDVQVADVEPQD